MLTAPINRPPLPSRTVNLASRTVGAALKACLEPKSSTPVTLSGGRCRIPSARGLQGLGVAESGLSGESPQQSGSPTPPVADRTRKRGLQRGAASWGGCRPIGCSHKGPSQELAGKVPMGSRGSRDAVGVEPNAKRRCARGAQEPLQRNTVARVGPSVIAARTFVRVVACSSASSRRCVKPAVSIIEGRG